MGKLSDLYRRRPKAAWAGTASVLVGVAAIVVIVFVGGGSEAVDVRFECSISNSDGSLG